MSNALLVDDRPVRLDTHARFLEALNIQSVKALDIGTANKLKVELPCFDFAIIDINFNPEFAGNKEGLDYARQLRAEGYPAYLAAYSAHYADNDPVMDEARNVFDTVMSGAPSVQDYKNIIASAREKKIGYLEQAALVQKEFIERGIGDVEKFIDMHDFHVENSKILSSEYLNYVKGGYSMKLVEPTYQGRIVGRDFLLWSKEYAEGVFLEVYKVPALFSYGENEKSALRMLNEVIVGMYSNSAQVDLEASSDVSDVWAFVKRIYETV